MLLVTTLFFPLWEVYCKDPYYYVILLIQCCITFLTDIQCLSLQAVQYCFVNCKVLPSSESNVQLFQMPSFP